MLMELDGLTGSKSDWRTSGASRTVSARTVPAGTVLDLHYSMVSRTEKRDCVQVFYIEHERSNYCIFGKKRVTMLFLATLMKSQRIYTC